MPKGSFSRDTFEQIAELGKSTVKKTGSAVKKTFDPLQILDQTGEQTNGQTAKDADEKGVKSKTNYTPLDPKKFKDVRVEKDEKEIRALRNRLFQLVKEGEKEVQEEKEKEKREKEQQELQEVQEKKNKEEEKQAQAGEIPRGKERRSIFSPKRKAKQQHTETRPSVGQG